MSQEYLFTSDQLEKTTIYWPEVKQEVESEVTGCETILITTVSYTTSGDVPQGLLVENIEEKALEIDPEKAKEGDNLVLVTVKATSLLDEEELASAEFKMAIKFEMNVAEDDKNEEEEKV